MSCYIISYDLRKERDYESLYEALKSYDDYVRILESVWAVKSDKSAEQVANHLRGYMDNDDGLFAAKYLSGSGAAWVNILCTNERLQEVLKG